MNIKKTALKNILKENQLNSMSVRSDKNDKSLSVSYSESSKTIKLSKEFIPEEIIKQKKGRFSFRISGNIVSDDKDTVSIAVKDYSVDLYEEPKSNTGHAL